MGAGARVESGVRLPCGQHLARHCHEIISVPTIAAFGSGRRGSQYRLLHDVSRCIVADDENIVKGDVKRLERDVAATDVAGDGGAELLVAGGDDRVAPEPLYLGGDDARRAS